MMNERIPEEYHFHPNGQPKLPPHARMPSPIPIGVGTPMVESLPSYLTRLCLYNFLVPSSFVFADVWPILVKYFDVTPLQKQGPCPYFQNMGGSIAGAAGHAQYLARALYWLTWRPEILGLNAEGLEGVIDISKSMLKHHRYCPCCLKEAKTPYIPLLFHFRPVEVCPTHQVPLQSVCPDCGKEQRSFSPVLEANLCSTKECCCDFSKIPIDRESATEVQLAVAEAIGQLLVLKGQSSFRKDVLYENLHTLAGHWGSAQAFGREIGLDPTSVRSWVNRLRPNKKPARPQLETLVAVSHRTKIPLPDLLSRKILKKELKAIPKEAPLTGWVRVHKRNRRPKFEERMAKVPAAMKAYLRSRGALDPLSFAEFARSIGEDYTQLAVVMKRDPEMKKLYEHFTAEKTAHKDAIDEQTRKQNIAILEEAIEEARRLGITPSLTCMQRAHIKLPSTGLKKMRRLIKKILEDEAA